MGSQTGALKIAAKRIGIGLEAYIGKIKAGMKWCYACHEWHDLREFGKDATRSDGLSAKCFKAARSIGKKRYVQKPRTGRNGPPPNLNWSGDRIEARTVVNRLVKSGEFPDPDDLPCEDCGHLGPDKRHSYDHHLGYEPRFYLAVEAVCYHCHYDRSVKRGESPNPFERARAPDGTFI